jgi:predicted nucleic-acid-binding protein
MRIVDANVVLRYLLDDNEELSANARQIIEGRAVEIPN